MMSTFNKNLISDTWGYADLLVWLNLVTKKLTTKGQKPKISSNFNKYSYFTLNKRKKLSEQNVNNICIQYKSNLFLKLLSYNQY